MHKTWFWSAVEFVPRICYVFEKTLGYLNSQQKINIKSVCRGLFTKREQTFKGFNRNRADCYRTVQSNPNGVTQTYTLKRKSCWNKIHGCTFVSTLSEKSFKAPHTRNRWAQQWRDTSTENLFAVFHVHESTIYRKNIRSIQKPS